MHRKLPIPTVLAALAAAALLLQGVQESLREHHGRTLEHDRRLDSWGESLAVAIATFCEAGDSTCLLRLLPPRPPAPRLPPALWSWQDGNPARLGPPPDGVRPAPADSFWTGASAPGPCRDGTLQERCRPVVSRSGSFVGVLEVGSAPTSTLRRIAAASGPATGTLCLLGGVATFALAPASIPALATTALATASAGGIHLLLRESPPVAAAERPFDRIWVVSAWLVLCGALTVHRRRIHARTTSRHTQTEADLLRLRTVFQSSRTTWWEWDADLRKGDHDPRLALLLGHPAHALDFADAGLWRGLCHPDDIHSADQAIQDHLAGRTTRIQHDLRLRRGDGTWGWYALSGSVVERNPEGGHPLRLAGLFEDASERRRITDDLQALDLRSGDTDRRLQVRSKALDEFAIVALTDAKGVIQAANDNFCAISGYQESELVGRTHRVVHSGFHPPEFFRDMWTSIRSGRTWRGRICNRAKDGHLYWVDTMIFPHLDHEGRVVEYLAVRKEVPPPSEPPTSATTPGNRAEHTEEPPVPAIGREGLEHRMLGNPHLRDKVLRLFLDRLPTLEEQVDAAIHAGSPVAADHLHALRGSAANLEAVALASLTLAMEEDCHREAFDDAVARLPRFHQACDAVRREALEILAG
jgi:PAS domain S-box-containing protein